ncbi:serine/arginine repetitive matrix protein 2 isoform X2 [Fopius arisanus]|uniref:Serine/arginine repetitive matrix protein 2 isoform X2 n=1 Tax=Fopius arisanus TaxID=64838 RepID=A0A9R1TVN9_9HYME|nr:PREDICTED: serine/arginine repetitive matrix protein 2-like isoform X2 [Fopius arisanus]
METGYLNFHDEEHFSDFSLSLDPHDSLEESSNSLMAIVESDFDYVETHQMDTTGGLWGTEQELNGDMAVLPDSGVASVIPKIENMKEDFAKVLIDWHEHIGYLQASDMEEDIDMSLSLPDKPTDLPADIFESPRMPALKSPRKSLGAPSTPDKQEQTMYKSFPSVLRGLVNPSQLGTSPGKIFEVSSPLKQSAVTPIQRKTQKSREDDPSESDDCIDIETVPEEVPVLEAGDVKSLLEQFEASEASSLHPQVYSGHDASPQDKSLELSKPNRHPVDSSKQTLLKKSLDSPASKFHKNIRDSLPKEVVDRIKASGRSKPISVIPALSQPRTLKNATRMQDAAATLSRNKLLKLVANSSKVEASVQLDHDYCSSIPSPAPDNSTKTIRKGQNNRLGIRRNLVKSKSWGDNSSRKDSGLESGDVSDASEEQGVVQRESKPREVIGQTFNQDGEPKPKPQDETVSSNSSSASISESISKSAPVYEMKIRSALATSILQLRQGVLTKTKSVTGVQKTKQMVSVLKKPPMPVVKCSEVASTENLREEKVVQIQNAPMLEEEKKPPRRKLNLAEYRSRREQTRSDNSRTCSPVQPMTLVYIHHASTTTEPLQDDPENPVWSEREIVSVLKPKTEVEEDKVKEKPSMCEKSVQTWEDEKEEEIREVAKVNDRRIRNYRHRRTSSSSSESRSPSRSRSRSRSRGRRRSSNRSRSSSSDSSCRSRSRSRSGSRSRRRNNRRRRISYRRSSVSSTSSWSSRSRSSYRSRSRSSRSRSRSSSSRSSRYSGCSRSSRSNLARKWSNRRRRSSSRGSHYNRGKRPSSRYRSRFHRRSPYRRAYDNWYSHEKERQVEERRVIYVGRLEDGVTKLELRRRFEIFGPVCDISLHFREHGDNYGFVTFAYKNDAYEAVEHGNDDITQPRYDLCFGGRRAFCKVKYADLDGMASNSFATGSRSMSNDGDNTFDLLLKEAKAKLQ